MFDTSTVQIFTGQNYSAWKFKFQVLMMERGLWGFFDRTEKKSDDESGIAVWKKKDQKVFTTLISRICINLVSAVRTCIKLEVSVHEAWKRLETIHVNKTLHCKILARNAFLTMKCRKGELMHEYATRVEELRETFMDLCGMVTEEDWILTLLCGLAEEWSTLITTLDSVQDTWTKEMVVGRLLHEESHRRKFANENMGIVMYSGGSSGKKSKWSKGSTKESSGGSEHHGKCHYCHKPGHFWHECQKRLSDWTPSMARDQEGNAHTASGEEDDSRELLVLLAGNRNKALSDVGFPDTGATQHMTHAASLLNNIGAPGDVTRIVFGNDKSLPVVGVGSTRLIDDGGPLDVTNVLHVPGLKVSLLSVPQLAKKGMIANIDGAKMKGHDPSNTVVVIRRQLLLAHSNVCHLLLQLSDVQVVPDLIRRQDEVPCLVTSIQSLSTAPERQLHHWRAAPQDDHEGEQVSHTKLPAQLDIIHGQNWHCAVREALQPGDLQLRFYRLPPGEEVLSTLQQCDGDPVR
ncbi:unnamed protein product [Closterium sp. NIES-53]